MRNLQSNKINSWLQAEHLCMKYLIKKVSMMVKFVSKCLKYWARSPFYNLCHDLSTSDWKGRNSPCDVVLEWAFGACTDGRVVGKLESPPKRGLQLQLSVWVEQAILECEWLNKDSEGGSMLQFNWVDVAMECGIGIADDRRSAAPVIPGMISDLGLRGPGDENCPMLFVGRWSPRDE